MSIDPNNLAGTAHLTFDDEFNTLSLWNGSTGTWDTTAPWEAVDSNGYTLAGNGEQEWYINSTYSGTSSVTPWTVSNGVMSLTGAPASAAIQPLIDNYQYTSGQLSTGKSFSQEYGYFEVNAKLPSGQGFWPAFWLMPENGSWPPELDVMENLGNNTSTYYTTVHYNADNEYQSSAINTGVDLSAGFHTYGVDWEPDHITWYFDGHAVYQTATPADMNTPMYMILNLALGGNWPGDVNASTQLPGSMQVDWVRAYAAGPDSSTSGSTTASAGTTSTSGGGTTTHAMAASGADFSGNGLGDILWFNASTGQESVWHATGSGFQGEGVGSAPAGWAPVGAGDFTADGKSDILWFDAATNQVSVWHSSGTGFTGAGALSAPAGWTPVSTGDFNGDGKSDILWFNPATHQESVWDSTGPGFQGAGVQSAPAGWSPVGTGDFNGDGKADILWFDAATNQVSIWHSTGSGFQGAGAASAPAGWVPEAVGDFNGDGKSDIFWFDAATHQATVWQDTGSGLVGTGVMNVPAGWSPVGVGDYNGDGKADVYWFNASTHQLSVWDSTGSGFHGVGVASAPADWTPVSGAIDGLHLA